MNAETRIAELETAITEARSHLRTISMRTPREASYERVCKAENALNAALHAAPVVPPAPARGFQCVKCGCITTLRPDACPKCDLGGVWWSDHAPARSGWTDEGELHPPAAPRDAVTNEEAQRVMDDLPTDQGEWFITREAMRGVLQRFLASRSVSGEQQKLWEAETALANTGLAGVYDEFLNLPDAIQQMAARIKELEELRSVSGETPRDWTGEVNMLRLLAGELDRGKWYGVPEGQRKTFAAKYRGVADFLASRPSGVLDLTATTTSAPAATPAPSERLRRMAAMEAENDVSVGMPPGAVAVLTPEAELTLAQYDERQRLDRALYYEALVAAIRLDRELTALRAASPSERTTDAGTDTGAA